MNIIDSIGNDIQKLQAFDDLTEKELLLSNYPHVEEATCGGEVPMSEVFDVDDIEDIYMRFKPYLDNPEISNASDIAPVIEGLGNAYVCLGFGSENKGFVYYLDFDFGCFLLDKNLDTFLSKLA
ncbi:hypothetical protein AAIA71_05825 [Vibrio harveyi]|jgi:hypothetical protein|uniref:RhsPI domain-containing protein n=2 Tax=Vibrio harveyi group TaxID=717610 RepID=A0AAU9QMG4_9VIBR|nr:MULTISPECIES: hypothetical protein [Vibrio harveyi group]EHK2888827.1 hypothetical protein [Vibrio parahaemolyticus]CAH1562966.1 conserved hypothetical protein [Vibrio owensii]AMF97034.1 hypothetical protein AL538_04405 [Vibrio harveyi]RCR58031.1 hypothetical protein DTW68_25615 [Vibrio harveyi]WVM82240.1 hypothetical protein V1M48_15005 [Vibrio harveyi]